MEKKLLGQYVHTKSRKLYEVIGVARHSETLEELIIYRALYETKFGHDSLWARPKSMFFEQIFHEGQWIQRFQKISLSH